MAHATKTIGGPSPESVVALEMPLWRIRLMLLWRSLRANVALFAENPIGLVGLAIIFFFFLMAIAHPILMATVWDKNVYHPVVGIDQTIPFHPAPPSPTHLLGTDPLGRDILSQLMWSARSEFFLGTMAALVTLVIATTVGAVSAFYGGIVDSLFMRLADLIIMTPVVTLMIVLSTLMNVTLIELAFLVGILSGFGGAIVVAKGIGFDTVAAHDLLQRLAFKSAEFGCPGHIALAGGKKIIDIIGIKRLQGLFLGCFIG